MISIHIRTEHDPVSGMVAVRVTKEPDGEVIARSDPIYPTHHEAEAEVVEVIRRAWPDRSPFAVDPSIGV